MLINEDTLSAIMSEEYKHGWTAGAKFREQELGEVLAELEVLQEWHAQHGMDCDVVKRPGGHLWRNAPGVQSCFCPHGKNHYESPLTLHEARKKEEDKAFRDKIADDVEYRFRALGSFHPYKPIIPLVTEVIRGES